LTDDFHYEEFVRTVAGVKIQARNGSAPSDRPCERIEGMTPARSIAIGFHHTQEHGEFDTVPVLVNYGDEIISKGFFSGCRFVT